MPPYAGEEHQAQRDDAEHDTPRRRSGEPEARGDRGHEEDDDANERGDRINVCSHVG